MAAGTQRRLTAMVSADVASYLRFVGSDEGGTLQRLNAH